MGSKWYVKPESVRLELGNGEWIEIKRELTIGEIKRLRSVATKTIVGPDGKLDTTADQHLYELERTIARLVDWSARDENDKPIPISRAAVNALPEPMYDAITDAIDVYMAEQEKEKNGKSSGSGREVASASAGT